MVHKIIWSDRAIKTYVNNIEYLEKEWSEKEVKNFIKIVQRKLFSLSIQPEIGILTGKRKNVRTTVLNKRVVLIYRYKIAKKEVELLHFFNTYQRPLD